MCVCGFHAAYICLSRLLTIIQTLAAKTGEGIFVFLQLLEQACVHPGVFGFGLYNGIFILRFVHRILLSDLQCLFLDGSLFRIAFSYKSCHCTVVGPERENRQRQECGKTQILKNFCHFVEYADLQLHVCILGDC